MTINSPNYPYYYPNNADCMWTITATYGQLNLVFNKFTVQSDPTCSTDYLQISGPIKKYRRARICGFPVSVRSHNSFFCSRKCGIKLIFLTLNRYLEDSV